MTPEALIPILLVVVPLAAGYAVRKVGWASERLARGLMTFVLVAGYPATGFFGIWGMDLDLSSFWLPALATVNILVMAGAGLLLGRAMGRDRADTGLIGISTALGNTGVTMGGLVLWRLYGKEGLGLMGIYGLTWMPIIVLVIYPLARHYARRQPTMPLWKLIGRSLIDWRSIGLPVALAATWLSLRGVAPPPQIARWRLLDIAVYATIPTAFFSVGLRTHAGDLRTIRRTLLAVSIGRFALGLAIGAAMVWLTRLTPWPLTGMERDVFLIEAFVPTAVTMVGVANMFDLKPRDASLLFVMNTLLYVAILLPVVLWVFAR